ncbi:unnamed protein product, partial [Polarella glacialis]
MLVAVLTSCLSDFHLSFIFLLHLMPGFPSLPVQEFPFFATQLNSAIGALVAGSLLLGLRVVRRSSGCYACRRARPPERQELPAGPSLRRWAELSALLS